jgi:hypothetical protein
VSLLDDQVVESREETFSLGLSSSQPGVLLAGNDMAIVTITDDDSLNVSLSESNLTVAEEVGAANLTLSLSGLHSVPVNVTISAIAIAGNAATAFEDFKLTVQTLTFQPGVLSMPLSFVIINDEIREETERFEVSAIYLPFERMGEVVTLFEGSLSQTTVYITDSDTVEVGLSTATSSISEGEGVVIVALEVGGQTSFDFKVTIFTTDGTAIANDDYQPLATELTFEPDVTQRELTILLTDDQIREETEEFRVQVTIDPLISERVRVGQNEIIVEIRDDDSVTVNWEAESFTASETVGVVVLGLVVTGSTAYNSTLLVSTYDRSATGWCRD